MIDKLLLALPGMRGAIARMAVASAAMAGLVIGMSALLAHALASLWSGSQLANELPLIAAAAICLALRAAVASARRASIESYARSRAAALRAELLEALFEQGPNVSSGIGSAAATTAVIEGVNQVENYIRVMVPKMAAIIVVPVALLLFLFPVDWVTGVIALVAFPFIILYMVMLGATAKAEAARRLAQFEELANHFMDSVRGIDTLRHFGASDRRAGTLFAASERFREATMKTLRIATLSGAVLDLFATLALAAVAIMLGFRLVDGTIGLEPALVVLVAVPEYFRPVREFAADYHASLDGKTSLAAIKGIVDAPHEQVQHADIRPWGAFSTLELRGASVRRGDVRALDDVGLTFEGFARVGVIGPSGAGKSTLASLIAGFESPDEGDILVDGAPVGSLVQETWRRNVIYIPQNPYVFHATLRDNVAFLQPDATDEEIARAVSAAGLDDLVSELPHGLDSIVGEGGRTLSGGERQRIAIARALVDRTRRIIVFDEPTAHLDIETEYELKERMLPLMEGRLVVFATHRLHWLDDMDVVVELEHGRVRAVSEGGHARAEKHAKEGASASAETLRSDAHEAGVDRRSRSFEPTPASPETVQARGARKRDRWVRPYLARYKRALAAAIALGIATYAFAVALMVTSGYLVSASAAAETILALHLPLLLVRIFGIGKPVLGYLERLASHDWVLRMTSLLRLDLYRALEHRAALESASRRTGEALGMLSDDIGHLQNLFLRSLFPTAVAWALSVAIVAFFGFLSPAMAGILALSFVIAAVLVPFAAFLANAAREQKRSALRSDVYTDLTDNVLGMADWVYAQRERDYLSRFKRTALDEAKLAAASDRTARLSDLAVQVVFAILLVVLAAWAASTFGGRGTEAANWIAAFAIGVFPLIDAFAPLPEAAIGSLSHRQAIERLNTLPNPAKTDDKPDRVADAPHRAPVIRVDAVSFSYPGADGRVLDGLSLAIPFGQKIAVLGRSGTGKSTLAALVRGDIAPDAGTVRIGGVDPASLGGAVSQVIGFVQQSTYLFRGTVLDNLRIGRPDATENEARAAIEAVGLAERIDAMEGGLHAAIDEAGANFSGGERHRIALARVLLLDPPIVILDEPCAGLDPDTERSVLETMFRVFADRTVVMITHHLEGASLADRVVFLEDGDIAQDNGRAIDGPPATLEQESARYARLLAFDRG